MYVPLARSVFPQRNKEMLIRARIGKKATKLEELCPMLSKYVVIIREKGFSLDTQMMSNYDYVERLIIDHLGRSEGFKGFGEWYTNISIQSRPDSVYQFKKSMVCDPDSDDNDEPPFKKVIACCSDSDSDYYYDDDRFPGDEYFSIVSADNIGEFVKKSSELWKGDDKIDPLDNGRFHRTRVYVHSLTTIPPIRFCDLVTRNATVYLVINEEVVDSFIEKSDLRTKN